MSRSALALSAVVVVLAGAAFSYAHEDDPKAQDMEPAFVGPVWRDSDPPSGVADTFASSNINLRAWFPCNTFNSASASGNDCWGYVSPSGREYALMGLDNGTGFVEVTNPSQATLVKFMPKPASASSSLWRNVKTYQQYAYSVSEGGGGIQIFDISGIDQGNVTDLGTVTTGGAAATHTMIINEQTGFLYRMGGGSNGVRCYSLANPAQPTFVSSWNPKYTHDGAVFNWPIGPYAGKEIFLACGGLNGGQTDTGMDILDVTDKNNITVIGRATYSNAAFCHQVWISPDYKYAYINDEIDESNFGINCLTRIINIENLANPVSVGGFTNGLVSVDHNLYIKGNQLFASNYKTGLRVYDITNRTNLSETAWFDTYPESDGTGYAGLWSNYPFLPSGTVLLSDIQRGLFVVSLGVAPLTISYPSGAPTAITPVGGNFQVTLALAPGQSIAPNGAKLIFNTGGPTDRSEPLQSLGGNLYRAAFPALSCPSTVSYGIEVTLASGAVVRDPVSGWRTANVSYGEEATLSDTMESGTNGWTVGLPTDDATTGLWVRVDPNGTTAQPEEDHTVNGTQCWVTGQGTIGGSAGAADVDGGTTTLTSPIFSAAGIADPRIGYWAWYSNNLGGAPNEDSMPVLLSNNGGFTWTQVELISTSATAWVERSIRISSFMTPTNQMQIRFQARDLGSGSLVEAAIDDLRVFGYDCTAARPADINGTGAVDGSDLALLLSGWGTAGQSDINGDGATDGSDLATLLSDWG
ncbi:MAG: choice-of-anchor B family protein [Planctomycetota bacterium]